MVWWGNLRERDHLEDSRVDGRIILRWIFGKWDVRGGPWAGFMWVRCTVVYVSSQMSTSVQRAARLIAALFSCLCAALAVTSHALCTSCPF